MFKREFRIGDRCRIRDWDDMLDEFGGDSYSIDCEYAFTSTMRKLCGKPFTVKSTRYGAYQSEEGTEGCFSISADMLEIIDPIDPLEERDGADLSAVLWG